MDTDGAQVVFLKFIACAHGQQLLVRVELLPWRRFGGPIS